MTAISGTWHEFCFVSEERVAENVSIWEYFVSTRTCNIWAGSVCGTTAFVAEKLTHKWEYKVFVKIDEAGIRFSLGHGGKVADEHATEAHHCGQTNEQEEASDERRTLLPHDLLGGRIEIPSIALVLLLLTKGRGGGSVRTGRGIGTCRRLVLSLAQFGHVDGWTGRW